ncbi:ABC transporter ATP-binding protein [Magnetofaba australis]|uniref:Putative ABC transporter n=1 Tax=Magnetofaba australis IT-1 TaxID=1434232 RepID=A0A1Y2K560_9PROT|nr:ABC transporter ATP-binding protein [Magnetofaba australis]OSM02145.1 putative ABC transporter [Magnetofaba australis IT-1]
MSGAALAIDGLRKTYANGVTALCGVDLNIAAGEVFAILGPNGAGKSTLINIVAQVTAKSAGRVAVMGVDIEAQPQLAKRLVGVTPQEIALDPFFTVRELLINHAGYYGVRKPGPWVDELLQRLDLAKHAHKRTRELSGGMKRRLTVAKSLVHQPPLVILDEPTAGVDVALRHGLWSFIRELHAQGSTVILTTHYLEEAQELAGRVAIINQGALAACDRTENLLADFAARRVEIQWKGENGAAPDVIPVGLQWDAGACRLHGELATDAVSELMRWAGERACQIADLRLEPPRLEDVYLHLTSGAAATAGKQQQEARHAG